MYEPHHGPAFKDALASDQKCYIEADVQFAAEGEPKDVNLYLHIGNTFSGDDKASKCLIATLHDAENIGNYMEPFNKEFVRLWEEVTKGKIISP